MKKQLTNAAVERLRPRAKRYVVADSGLRGLFVRVLPTGVKAYVTVCRDPYKKQVWTTIERTDLITIDEARDRAREILRRVRDGQPAIAEPPAKPQSVKDLCEDWYQRVAVKQGYRTAHDIKRDMQTYIFPLWKNRDFISLKRSDLAALLDHIEDNHGSRTADVVAARIKAVARWYTSRNDDYVNPFFGTSTQRHKKPARSRILDDAELRALWLACPDCGRFGDLLKLCLLTGQRVSKIQNMKWSDLDGDEWIIRTEPREKGNATALVLTEMALELIHRQPKMQSNEFIFAGRSKGAMKFSTARYKYSYRLPPGNWCIHDLRRCAKSLMSRCGVRPEVSERVLGHAIKGIERVYDRHSYRDEKADALRRLAGLVESIVRDDPKVVQMKLSQRR